MMVARPWTAGRRARWLLAILVAGFAGMPGARADQAGPYFAFDVAIEAPAPLRPAIERALDIRRWQGFEFVTPELLDQLVVAARQRTRDVLETEGYFSADVVTRIDPTVEPRRVTISVQPGEPARIASVVIDFTGPAAADSGTSSRLDRIRAAWLLPRGATFRQDDWDRAKDALVADLASVSFAAARIAASLARVEENLREVNLRLEVESGPPFYFGPVSVVGLSRYSPELVQNLAPFSAGTPYSWELIRRFERRLALSGYFSSIHAVIDTDPAVAARTPVTVAVMEAMPRSVEVSLGFSTDTRARFGVAYTDNDLFQEAFRLRSDLRLESLRQGVTATVERPPGRSGWINAFSGVVQRTDIQDLETEEWTFGVQRRRLNERNEPAFGVEWTTERQEPLGAPSDNTYATLIGYQHSWRSVDDLLSPTRGGMLRVNAGIAPPGVSTQEFAQLLASGAYYLPLSPRDELRFRADLGWIIAESSTGIPQHFLFRTGGDTSVRGHEYQSLGVEAGSAIVGGRYLAVGSVEYTRWIGANWGIAGFVDAGNATDTIDSFRAAVGYGLGMRVRSPVGVLRFDFATNRNSDTIRLHFSLGVKF